MMPMSDKMRYCGSRTRRSLMGKKKNNSKRRILQGQDETLGF
jgi:hypothetical protein